MSESLNPLPFPVQIDPDALGRVVVLMGGHSSERNVSLDSGRNVLKALQAKGVNAEAFDPAERSLGDLEKAGYDRAFIALHGRYGEDGTIQGVLEMLGIPYTGSGVMASAVAIDKISTKQMACRSSSSRRMRVPRWGSPASIRWTACPQPMSVRPTSIFRCWPSVSCRGAS